MKNRIITIIILISITVLSISMFHGINIGKLKIPSIAQINEENNKLHEKIEEASQLAIKDYNDNVETLTNSFNDYITVKEKYEQLVGFEDDKSFNKYESKKYDISYLWRVLGNYAEKRNLTLGIDVQNSDKVNSLYSFNFTVSGEYVKIIEFITDLENDSDLYFRIYDFKISGSGTNLTATFKVENITIDSSTINVAQSNDSTNLFNEK